MAARTETRGRSRALQALYAWDVRGDVDLVRVAHLVWDDLGVTPNEREFADRLILRIAADRAQLDADLSDVTTHWRIERLGAIERCVLRLGAAELAQGVTPPKVVIQEYVRLAERYGTDRSAAFVNGVLDAHARRIGALA
ncbi:MAG TPA: transcription antitermination factor NusB [Gemmatimonadaceae bacterium]|nr:transcription antitermination factor NusB [Gemmatimonadaceae bacterium]